MGELTLDAVRVVTMEKLDGSRAGGKAEGLRRLGRIGLNVPPALVVLPSDSGISQGREDLRKGYRSLGEGPVAVRSSALDEDSAETSAAGQYETFLNVTGIERLEEAVLACFRSVETARVAAYRKSLNPDLSPKGTFRERERLGDGGSAGPDEGVGTKSLMAVVVQKMIPADVAGVVFTVNPVGSADEVVIEAVAGLGDKLVGGFTEGMRYTLPKEGPVEEYLSGTRDQLLTVELLEEIRKGALEAESEWGIPLDLEWAVDSEGTLHWLQARPVTTLAEDSLDIPIGDDELITRCNIGEMLPGAATPLTLSVFAEPLDWGLREMYRREGVLEGLEKIPRFIISIDNHLFMNLTAMNLVALSVAGASREAIELNILGRVLPPYEIGKKKPGILRVINGLRYAFIILGHNRYMRRFERLARRFELSTEGKSARELYHDLRRLQETVLNKAYFYHYCISSYSGAMNSILAAALAGGSDITVEAHARVGTLLTRITGIESADVLASLRTIAREIRNHGKAEEFLGFSEREALDWLSGIPAEGASSVSAPAPAHITGNFARFLERHGHRCIREADLRSRDYATYPEEVVKMIRDTLEAGGDTDRDCSGRAAAARDAAAETTAPSGEKEAPKWILKSAKEGVRQREFSKSLLILVQHQFKLGYRRLAELLTEEGVIPDEDLIYFFTRDEIGGLTESKAPGRVIAKAQKRRNELPYKMDLIFPEVSWGRPEPVSRAPGQYHPGAVIRGTPVSSGVVEGTARVVKRLEEAYDLQRGEIMIAPFTDIGWTPFFSIISGLVTEIGGALSHGAVVAREYGMPMVSNLPGITDTLKTGTRIRIDGRAGTISLLEDTGLAIFGTQGIV